MSVSSKELAEGAITFYRQGLGDDEVNERLVATTQYAKTASISFEQSANMITAAVNNIETDGRGMEMTAQRVADVFLYLGDNAATSGEEIGTAMSRSASLADAAGVSFEMLGAYIATVSERTRQDAGTIGTALNAIMSRLTNVKNKGFNEEDETKVNDVAKALQSVNVQLTDGQGEWRRIEDIFMDVAKVWDDLDDKTRNYLATVMAGTRQQNVFRTLMADLSQVDEGTSRAMELYEGALNSAGTAAQKYATYQESVTAAHDKMIASLEKLYSLFDANVMKGLYQVGGATAEGLYKLFTNPEETDYSRVVSGLTEQQTVIENSIESYKKLADQQSKLAEGSVEYVRVSQQMDSVIESLAAQYPPFAQKVQEVGGHFSSADTAIEAMNEALAEQLDIIRGYNWMDIGHRMSSAADDYAIALDKLETAKRASSTRDTFAQLSNILGFGDINQLSEETFQQLYTAINNAVNALYAQGSGLLNGKNGIVVDMIGELMFGPDGELDENAFNSINDLLNNMASEGYVQAWQNFRVQTTTLAQAEVTRTQNDVMQTFIDAGKNTEAFRVMSEDMQSLFIQSLTTAFNNGIKGVAPAEMQNVMNSMLEYILILYDEHSGEIQEAQKKWFELNPQDFNIENDDDIIAVDTAAKAYADALLQVGIQVDHLSLADNFWSKWKAAEDDATKGVQDYYEAISAGRKQEAYDQRKAGGFAWEMESLKRMADAKNYEGIDKFFARIQSTDPTRWEDMTKEYGNLNTILDEFTKGHYENAYALLGEAMEQLASKSKKAATEQEKAVESVIESSVKAYKAQQNEIAKSGGYQEEKSKLLSLLESGDKDAIDRYFGELQLEGKLQGIYDTFARLEASYGLFQSNVEEGSKGMVAALTNEISTWDAYTTKVKNALNTEITSTEGIDIANRMMGYVGMAGNLDNLKAHWDEFSQAEQEWLSKNIDGFDEFISQTGDAAENLEKMKRSVDKLASTDLSNNGKVSAKLPAWMESAYSGKGISKSIEEASDAATKFYKGIEAIEILTDQSLNPTLKDTDQAYKNLAASTGLTEEALRGNGGLDLALQALSEDGADLQGTLEFLATKLQKAGAVDFGAKDWAAQLKNAQSSADQTTRAIANLTDAILKVPGNVDIHFNVSSSGSVSVGGGIFGAVANGVKNVASGAWNFISGLFKKGETNVQQTVAKSNRSGGGGGSSSSKTDEVTEIEKMIELMQQLQKFSEFRQNMYSEMRDYYDTRKELQGVILYYEKERDEIESNNKVIEENLEKIKAMLPAQQALVASMSTTDENYKQQSDDLDKLQNAYESYSKQLIENRTQILEYNEAIKETNRKIRQMEIDLRDTVLQAIMDREQREKDMADARMDMEDEILDHIKTRYEKERDLILDNAKAKKDSLNEEKSLLDEVLNKRKQMEEQEDKQKKLLDLEQKLARISADPSRRKEQQEIRKQINDLRKEMAWDLAEDEVEAQKDSIDQQITSLDDYIDYVKEYYDDLFKHPQKLIEEMKGIMAQTDEQIIAWLKANDESYAASTETTQASMVNGWNDTLMQMHGMIKTYWEEVEQIIAQGDDYIIEFLKANSQEYREAGALQAEAYVDEWKQQLEELRLAYKNVMDDMKFEYESTIRLAEEAEQASSRSGGGGGTSSNKTKDKTKTTDPNNPNDPNKPTNRSPGLTDLFGNVASWLNNLTGNNASAGYRVMVNGSYVYGTYKTKEEAQSVINKLRANGNYETSDKLTIGSAKQTTSKITSTAKQKLANMKSNPVAPAKATTTSKPKSTLSNSSLKSKVASTIKSILKFDTGGTADFTGLAWLDGTKSRPEQVLSPQQTEDFHKLLEIMETVRVNMRAPNVNSYMGDSSIASATFGDINISVASMDSDTDVAEMTDKIMEEISSRMNRGKVVGGLRHTR